MSIKRKKYSLYEVKFTYHESIWWVLKDFFQLFVDKFTFLYAFDHVSKSGMYNKQIWRQTLSSDKRIQIC
jgi:hypothetical protein